MAGLTANQLQQILDINSKALEAQIEIGNILDILKDLKLNHDLHKRDDERFITAVDIAIKNLEDILDKQNEITRNNHGELCEQISQIRQNIKTQTWVITGALFPIILTLIGIIAKLLGVDI